MAATRTRTRVWMHGFATGVAACSLALYAKRKFENRRPRIIHEDSTVIPIE